MLRRKIEAKLESWASAPKRTAVLVTGARQTGKTYIIRHFAQRHYDHVAELNFIENPDLVTLFDHPRDVKNLLMRLELAVNTPLVPGKTLIFFDEVQRCKELVTAIKFLVDDGRFDYALSGSLLGVELEDIRSVPVGYLTELNMHPLDFQEFCWSQHIGDDVFDMLSACLTEQQAVDGFIHQQLMELYAKYLVIGGMPAAVDSFAANNSVADVRVIKRTSSANIAAISASTPAGKTDCISAVFTIWCPVSSTIRTRDLLLPRSRRTCDSNQSPPISTGWSARMLPSPHIT